jgi:glycosyltransferase involved in cell wall biosynthesis
VFPAGNVEELAAVLREILSTPEKRALMGAASKKRMETWSPREYAESVARALQAAGKSSIAP